MENNRPEISVLIPVYNTEEKYLRECIESILNQTFRDFELIILNDGSSNNVEEIIKSYDDKRILYYKNEKTEGITKSRNKLISLASGKYIAIQDHDDISFPDRLEKEYNFLENHKDISIVSAWIEVFSEINYKLHKKKIKVWKKKESPKILDFLKRCELIHPVCMWRKNDFEKYNLAYEDGYYGAQDYALFSKAVRYLKFANIQEPLLKYRRHPNNVSRNKKCIKEESLKVKNEILEYLTSDDKDNKILYILFKKYKISFFNKIKAAFLIFLYL